MCIDKKIWAFLCLSLKAPKPLCIDIKIGLHFNWSQFNYNDFAVARDNVSIDLIVLRCLLQKVTSDIGKIFCSL